MTKERVTKRDVTDAQRRAREWDAAHPREPEALTLNRLPASERVRFLRGASKLSPLHRLPPCGELGFSHSSGD
jgi:hypothetical protein